MDPGYRITALLVSFDKYQEKNDMFLKVCLENTAQSCFTTWSLRISTLVWIWGLFNLESLHMFNKILMSRNSGVTVINTSSTKLE